MTTDSITLKKALVAIKKLKRQLDAQQQRQFQPIAIVGLSCRFPEVATKEDYWNLLATGKNVISSIPDERWKLLENTKESPLKEAAKNCKGSFLRNIQAFDPYFFGITPREAMRMDPQQRLLLQVAYEAFEDAGLTVENLAGSATGVFTSLYASQYAHLQNLDNDMDALYVPTGNAVSMASNRLSYLFDLRGPSMVFDTSCSSSLVALHIACLNLQVKLCSTAIVCAANINLLPSLNILLSKAKMLSPDGQCKTFDADANGYVQGEGIGAIVLKPLADALHSQDRIYAVIAGTAVNQDGKTNGLTAPNGLQQEALLKAAQQIAHVEPKQISYLECHGTGTFLGDPIEAQAIGEVLGHSHDKDHPCWIGSVKTNLGHLEPASGIASIIKVALSLQKSQIPPHLNFNNPNPHIAFDKYHLQIPTRLQPWPIYGNCRIAGVSGFGFGGTNAHIILREALPEEMPISSPNKSEGSQIFELSAKDPNALKHLINAWRHFLNTHSELNLSQICYNLQKRRSSYAYKLKLLVSSTRELLDKLTSLQSTTLENLVDTDMLFCNVSDTKALSTLTTQSDNASIYPHMDMPLYPWQNKDFWPELIAPQQVTSATSIYPFATKLFASPLPIKQFEFTFDTKTMPEIADTYYFLHAGFYCEMLARSVDTLYQKNEFSLTNLSFHAPIQVPENVQTKIILTLEDKDNQIHFNFYTLAGKNDWISHASGSLQLETPPKCDIDSLNMIKQHCNTLGTKEDFFARITSMNMPSGDSIRWTDSYSKNPQEILCQLKTPATAQQNDKFKLNVHLGIIDACIQSLFLLLPDEFKQPYIASHFLNFTYFGTQTHPAYIYAILNDAADANTRFTGQFYLLDEGGNIIAQCQEVTMTQLGNRVETHEIGKQDKIDLSFLSSLMAEQHISKFLTEQVATLFSMSTSQINPDHSLQQMGIDSLMAIALTSAIKNSLNFSYPMQSILQGVSISEITQFIVSNIQTLSVPQANPWIAFRNPRKQPELRLFCFPYGGSGASIYRDWQDALPSSIEICPIQLPGRENRLDEPPIADLIKLINELLENIQPELNLPFMFFGHSFGALVAFELARVLRSNNLPTPMHLIASAFPDPRTPTKSLEKVISQLANIDIHLFDLSMTEMINRLSTEKIDKISQIFIQNGLTEFNNNNLMNKDVLKLLLPIFISDMSIVRNYQYTEEAPFKFPISVFSGKQDQWVHCDDLKGWKHHTTGEYRLFEFEGGHLFLRDEMIRQQMFAIIKSLPTSILQREGQTEP